jgi:hypothetical protein
MSFEEFQASIASDTAPPAGADPSLQALWHDARGDWTRAHECVQDDRDGAWVHAYLHRKEGDLGNAGYWYSRAGRRMPASSLGAEDEWASIAQDLLARGSSDGAGR